MGKLISSLHASKLEKITRPHYWRQSTNEVGQGRKAIPVLLQVRIDPSDAKYEWIDGKRRRKPQTLPADRRYPVVAPKKSKRRKAA